MVAGDDTRSQCFFTFPAVAYQILVPMWTRAWRLQSVYGYAAIDCLLTILWLAAFISMATYRSDGIRQGAQGGVHSLKYNRRKSKDCKNFGFGSEAKCQAASASIGFSFVCFVLCAVAAVISLRSVARKEAGSKPQHHPEVSTSQKTEELKDSGVMS